MRHKHQVVNRVKIADEAVKQPGVHGGQHTGTRPGVMLPNSRIFHAPFAFLAFSLVLLSPCAGQRVTGHVIVRATGDTSLIREHNTVWIRLPDGNWRITGLDENFNFSYGNPPAAIKAGITEIRINTLGHYRDTVVSNIIISENKTTHVEIPYPPYCEYENAKNDSLCPVCNKHDQVSRIVYEPYANPPKGRRKRKKYWHEHNMVTGCDPRWYCGRDNRKF